MKKAKIIYVDMDDVIADFYSAAMDPKTFKVIEHRMWDSNFFLNLKPIPGAQGAIFDLQKMGFDIWILSQPLADHAESYLHKAQWIQLHFPQLYKKIILTQDKSLNLGHYLIDDNAKKWQEKFEQNGGKFIHFNYGGYNSNWAVNTVQLWRDIVKFFENENPYLD